MDSARSGNSAPYKIAIEVVRQLLQVGTERGLPVQQLLAEVNLDLSPLPDQPAYIDGRVVEQLLAFGLRQLQDPLPGLLVSRWQAMHVFGLVGLLVQTTATVGSLMETIIRVEPLLGDVGITRLRREPGTVHLVWDCRFTDPYVRFHAADFVLAAQAWGILTAARPGMRVLDAVHLQHPAPDDPALLQRYLDAFGCPVYFNQPEYRLVLPREVLDLPLPSADPQLHAVLEGHARRLLAERSSMQTLVDLARSRLHQLLQAGDASRERLADVLGMSSRTLHRRLEEAGSSYRGLLDDLRLEQARELLRDETLGVQEVALRAGFAEPNSFTRWFRQRTGIAPSEFRQQLRQE